MRRDNEIEKVAIACAHANASCVGRGWASICNTLSTISLQ